MSPMYERIMDMLRRDEDTSFLRDASRSGAEEAIRVRLHGRGYEIRIEGDLE